MNVFDDTNGTNFCNQIATDEMNIAPNEFLNEQCNELFNDITIEMLNQPSSTMMKFSNKQSALTNLPENVKSYELELLILFSRLDNMSEIPRIKVIQIITHFSKINYHLTYYKIIFNNSCKQKMIYQEIINLYWKY